MNRLHDKGQVLHALKITNIVESKDSGHATLSYPYYSPMTTFAALFSYQLETIVIQQAY